MFLLAVASVLSVASCSSDLATDSKPAATTTAGAAVDTTAAHPAATYVCPMDPEVNSTQPGQKCSKCGMDLEKKL